MRIHCQRCEDKDAELEYLRGELALVDNIEAERRLRVSARLEGNTEPRILLHLMRCRHHTATRLQLADLLGEDTNPKAMDVFLSRIRGRLGHDLIETIWGQGFRLTEVGMARLEALGKEAHHG